MTQANNRHWAWADIIIREAEKNPFEPLAEIIASHLADFETELATALAEREADGWKPIEDAPMGKRVLVLYKWTSTNGKMRHYWVPATYHDKFTLPMHEDALPEDGDWHEQSGEHYSKEGWYLDEDDEGMCMPLWTTPTHYREITLPPMHERKE